MAMGLAPLVPVGPRAQGPSTSTSLRNLRIAPSGLSTSALYARSSDLAPTLGQGLALCGRVWTKSGQKASDPLMNKTLEGLLCFFSTRLRVLFYDKAGSAFRPGGLLTVPCVGLRLYFEGPDLSSSLLDADMSIAGLASGTWAGTGICDLRASVAAQQKQIDSLVDRVAMLLSSMHSEAGSENTAG